MTFDDHFFDFFEYMQVLCTFGIKMLIFLSICRFRELQVPQTCIYSKKQHFDAKSAQNLHILKKIKSFDSEKSPNLHILKNIKNFRLYVGLTGIDELVFDFFEYMQVW